MSDEQLNKILMKADDDLQALKDRCHELYEENERLKEQSLLLIDYQDMEQRYNDYKTRCEKAIEYIKSGKTFDNEDAKKVVNKIQNDLLNILQNGSDDNGND